jgi:pyrroline-5-carboxylate reductase
LTGTKTIRLDSSTTGSLIRGAADQSFIIDGITLAGKADKTANNAALVYTTGSNSAVEFRGGVIRDNDGGGVYVWSGTFNMTGGTISGNTAIYKTGAAPNPRWRVWDPPNLPLKGLPPLTKLWSNRFMDTIIACIGSGNMGAALMKGAAAIGGGGNIGFADVDRARAEDAARSLGASVYASNTEAAAKADFVFLALKPQVLPAVLAEIAPALAARLERGAPPLVVSMAAGFSLARIRSLLGAPVPLVRIMPNTPALVSQGVIAMAVPADTPEGRAAELERILSAAGIVERVEEKHLDAVTGLSGSGPAFVCLFIEALADGGVRAGLNRGMALRFAAQTVLGTAALVKETGKHPAELKDMVASPAGTTIAGLAALENGAFRGTVMNAVEAAWKRSLELG